MRISRITLHLLAALCAVVLFSAPTLAAEPELATMRARVEFSSSDQWEAFLSLLPELDIMKTKPGIGATIITNGQQVEKLRGLGFNVTVEVPDLQTFYRSRMGRADFGDFHTWSEMVAELDQLHAAYPSITTDKISIGTTAQGRDIWAMKISDNPDVDESEPEVLFDGMHHAREPMAMEAPLYFMNWLCDNYGTDPEATYLVDNREIWFIPIVNPDGYVYNETMGWGTMWRKNRRVNAGSGCLGVDNNRNYDWQWGTTGISTDPCNEVYCGTAPFSELEDQAYRDFATAHDFVANISFHSVAASILVPWSYSTTAYCPDAALFTEIANTMAESNGYDVGRAGNVIGYTCSGTTCDWFYGELGCLSVCIEVGGSDFWPEESELPGLDAENLWPQQYISRIAGSYLALRDNYTISGGDEDQDPDPGETLDLVVTIDNQGVLAAASNVSITLTTNDPYVQLNQAHCELGNIAARGFANNAAEPFSFTLDPSTPDGHGLILTVGIEADDFETEEQITWMVGEPSLLFSDDMENGTGNWIENDGYWGITTSSYHSSGHSYTDSPTGQYGNYRNTWIELANPIDLSNAVAAELRFWHRVETEDGWDYCYAEGSPDGGTTWLQIGERYDGSIPWSQVVLPLDDFAGASDFKVRFRLNSDSYITDDGWYVDDVEIYGPPSGNGAPTAPTLADPPDGGSVSSLTPTLTVENATDPDPGDELTYGFIVYDDVFTTSVVAQASGITETSETTSWTVDTSLSDGTYYWRCYADDGNERGPLMGTGSFTVDGTGAEGAGPARLALRAAHPNPFMGETTLSFELPRPARASLAVYSVDGRLVRTLVQGALPAGPREVRWDGRDDGGARVGSGLYFVRLVADRKSCERKVIVLH